MWDLYQSAAEDAAAWEHHEEAERLYRAALREAERFGPDDSRLRATLEGLNALYGHRTDTTAPMVEVCWRLLLLQEAALGPDDPALDGALDELARACAVRGMPVEAEALYRRRIALAERWSGPESAEVVDSLIDLALHLQDPARPAEEEALWRRAIAIVEVHGPNSVKLLHLLRGLAECVGRQGRVDEAVPLLQRAMAIAERGDAGLTMHVTSVVEQLADAYLARQDWAAAEPLLRRALANVEASDEEGADGATDWRGAYGRALLRQGHDEHCLELLRSLTGVAQALGRDEEAATLHERAEALQPRIHERARVIDAVDTVAGGTTLAKADNTDQ